MNAIPINAPNTRMQPICSAALRKRLMRERVCRACCHAWGCKSPVQVCVEPKDK